MEGVPGGLSGGRSKSNEENSVPTTRDCGSSATTAPLNAGATSCANVAPNIEFGRLTSFWQHECDEGMFIDPHCCAMCLQQARSASVISASGMRQDIAGIPNNTNRSNAHAS